MFGMWQALAAAGLATPNIGTLTDMICCPDSIFAASRMPGPSTSPSSSMNASTTTIYLYDLGELDVKMSGCMNACGHHHVGAIGILGVDKADRSGTRSPLAARPAPMPPSDR